MPMFEVIYKNSRFLKKTMENISLIVHHFPYRANRDSKSKFETTLGLVSTPQIQWRYQNLETSFH